MAAFPTTAIDLTELIRSTITTFATIKDTANHMIQLSNTSPVTLGDLNGMYAAFQRQQSEAAALESRVRPSDYNTLRTAAQQQLRTSAGAAYAGDFVADYATARDALVAFLTWFEASFPLSVSLAIDRSGPLAIVAPPNWASASTEATALRAQLQLLVTATSG